MIAMLVGRIIGKTTPERFFFEVTEIIKKFDFVATRDPERHWILGRVDSIFQEKDKTIARVSVIGYKDQRGIIKTPRMPFKPGSLVYKADDYLIKKVLDLKSSGLYVGLLQSSEKLKVFLDPQKLIAKHVAILAKSGFGKSYLAGVILEEFIENQIPAVIIDPHGEYITLREKNDNPEELKYASRFEINPKSYRKNVDVYCLEKNLTEGAKKLKFSDKLSHHEIYEMLPFRLSGNQMNIIYTATRNLDVLQYSLDDLIKEVELVRSKAKWNVISVLETLKSTNLFTDKKPTNLEELIKPGKISVINLRGIDPDIQTLVVYKLARDLFEMRKASKIPPFLFVIEEAHNFCPERGFGEVVSSKILRTIASEGRKFGMGMCIISQRAARVDKNVLSQCNTQIFLRVNNPNDIKSISDSVEGITHELESEIKTLPVGTALITGVIDQPLLVDIRIRRTKHGGTTSILTKEKPGVEEGKPQFFVVKIMEEELKHLVKKKIEQFRLVYYPMWRLHCQFREKDITKEDNIFVDGITGELIYRKNDVLKRTENIFKIADLPMKEKAVVLYLTTYGEAPAPKIAEKLNLSLTSVKQTLEGLQKLELVTTDGFLFKSNVSVNFTDVIENQINDELSVLRSKGELLDFNVEKDEAKSILNIFQPDSYEITQCYYPYWIVECEDGDTLIIDALTGKRDDYLLDTVT
jgi:hypothetical protein